MLNVSFELLLYIYIYIYILYVSVAKITATTLSIRFGCVPEKITFSFLGVSIFGRKGLRCELETFLLSVPLCTVSSSELACC